MMTSDEAKSLFKKRSELEIMMRGKVMQITSRIETYLIQIMLLADFENPKAKPIPFRDLKYYEKINKAQKYLKKYSKILHAKHQPIFSELHKLKEFRNLFAHCSMTWEGEGTESFTLWDMKEDKTDLIHSMMPKVYSLKEVGENVAKLTDLQLTLLSISAEMAKPVLEKHPELLPGWNAQPF